MKLAVCISNNTQVVLVVLAHGPHCGVRLWSPDVQYGSP